MCDYRLFEGDCLKILPRLIEEGVVVDCVLTDPPYGTTACKWDSIIPFKEMWKHLINLTNETTPYLFFSSEPFSSMLRMSNIDNYHYDLIWYKNSSGSFVNAKKMPMKYHENINVFYKKLPVYNPQFQEYSNKTKHRFKKNGNINSESQKKNNTNQITAVKRVDNEIKLERGKYPESILKFDSVPNSNNIRNHPTEKPVELLEYLIKTYTKEGDLVLDFTMGSGSTGVACANTGRQFIGIEIEPKYYKIAEKRIREAYNQTKLI